MQQSTRIHSIQTEETGVQDDPRGNMMTGAEATVRMLEAHGVRYNFGLWRVAAKGTRIVHIDSDPEVVTASYRTEVAVVSDARLTLAAMNAALAGCDRPASFRGAAAAAEAEKWAAFRSLASSNDRPIKPERTIAALRAPPAVSWRQPCA